MSKNFQQFIQGFENNNKIDNNVESKTQSENKKNTHLKLNLNNIKKDGNTNKKIYDNKEHKIQQKEKINKIEKQKNNDSQEKEIENEKNIIDELFIKTGTNLDLKENWIKIYKKALDSNKNNDINKKVREGKFRITKDGNIEILPEFETYGKSSKCLLNEHWNI